MDVLTHGLLPYAAALAALGLHRRDPGEDRRGLSWALALGLAATAPDFDALVSWMSKAWDGVYFLQHRGFSHSLLGSVVFALVVLALGHALATLRPRWFGLLKWRPSFLVAAILGAWTHMLLDFVTLSGVPWLWPFASGRASLELFGWLVWWLFPIAAVVLLLHWAGQFDARRVVQAGALVLAILVILAGVRIATRPPGEFVYPRNSEFEWTLVRSVGNDAWEASLYKFGARSEPMEFRSVVPVGAEDAIAQAKGNAAFKGWQLQSYGPVVTIANRTPGGWNVTFIDVAERFEALHHPTWTPAKPIEAWGEVSLVVTADGVLPTVRGW